MTTLALPDVSLAETWASAIAEFGSETIHGSGVWHGDGRPLDLTRDGCAAFVDLLAPFADPTHELPEDRVHSDYFWILDEPGGAVVGFIAVRHALTPWLLDQGGHIGYSVRPSRRREGHATAALGLAVDRAGELGLDRVLVTCDDDNLPSARTIELNGGVLEDIRSGTRRYWIETRLRPRRAADGRSAAPA